MGVQTGVETPRGPASRQLGDRVRFRVDRWRAEPNPLWMREMRQSARLMRTPVVLMVVTVLVAMLMAAIGGVMTGTASPAEAGTALFHTFFSLAYFVVTLVGPALAANSIASEREGHTWEAVLLTGMRPAQVARGKFLSSYTSIAMYVVMLAPVGALPFLFGGITPIEVLVAFLFLFLMALLGVAFGLAISSKMQSLRVAILVTLLLAIPISVACFLALGVGLSVAAHELWTEVPAGPPVWLPTAYGRAPLGVEYLVYLIALPVVGITLPAWFLYEVTNANLTSVTDDRSRGLKRWYLVAAVATTAACAVPMFAGDLDDVSGFVIAGACVLFFFVVFCAFLFAGEPIGPSRRVQATLAGAGRLRRWLAPGVIRATVMQLLFSLAAVGALAACGIGYVHLSGAPRPIEQIEQIVVFCSYAAGFVLFTIGLTAYLRARASTPAVPRVLLLVFHFILFTLPWIAAAVAGVLTRSSGGAGDAALAVASPSPIYAGVAVAAVSKPDPGIAVIASMSWSVIYALVGLLFVAAAARRCNRIIADHEQVLVEADRRLAEEDRRRAE
ncbi:MAG: ABC transporter permease, partial [Deltaproteobacteria bacterium]|nr:ABC transporter permease [Deltaproteobacteria bacterium]MBW2535906.1 ABC transporter permease [Deltaproteobacteria bacterium]